jgi:MYXO-CTERM domain-containing protein
VVRDSIERRHRYACLVAACVSLLGCSDDGFVRPVGQTDEAIYYGAPQSGEPWAVAVFYTRPGTTKIRLCTGSLIAPKAVLTAKHCIFDEASPDNWVTLPPSVFTAAIGTDVTGTMQQEVGVFDLRTTPGIYTQADATGGNDIAILLLVQELATPPKPISTQPPMLGDPLQIIGFGFTQDDVLGLKHSGTTSISDLNPGVFESMGPAWTCSGDSGGPAVHAGRGEVLGISSYGPSSCNVPDSYYTRIDTHLPMINDAIAASGGGAPPPPGCTPNPEVCDGVDNDCDGVIDPGCEPLPPGSAGAGAQPPPTVQRGSSSSSGCAVSPPASGSPLWLVLVGAGLLRRRRHQVSLTTIGAK